MKSKICKLIFFGNRHLCVVAKPIIAASLQQNEANQLLDNQKDELSNEKVSLINKGKFIMVKKKFSSLAKTQRVFDSGKEFSKQNYTFRIDSPKLIAVMDYLQAKLKLKPGCMQNVTIAGNRFKNFPVNERDVKYLESISVNLNA